MPDKRILIIAGPNGAGKTTFAREFLPKVGCSIFVNADDIAQAMSPGNPEAAAVPAGREMLRKIEDLVFRFETFAFETTLSGLAYAQRIPKWRMAGYHVKLVFLSLPNPDMAVERVKTRVSRGGHSIPEPVIRRRFQSGFANFQDTYRPIVDRWSLYDNSGAHAILIASGPEDGEENT